MEREILFAKTLEQVKKQGRAEGNRISKEQVREAFVPLALDEAQLSLVYDYLEKHHIGVDQEASVEIELTKEETDYLEEYLASRRSQAESGRRSFCLPWRGMFPQGSGWWRLFCRRCRRWRGSMRGREFIWKI